ncbi:PREDICTED: RING finger protein 17 [Buceros rhinoceros silvestris]|uniref:RING finger protein 17 n=1 Tax=Buceros rhinoceros silvestris TaxID=175836 RepID=UPI000528B93B|nr:PREDICTED: RING finger protein 17 [Buceros rhinoceros silvestris]
MNKKKEFSLVDDSKDEHNRRKTKAVRQRFTILEEDFVEPNQRNRELCHMLKSMSGEVIQAIFPQVSKTREDIDEAFCIASCNLSHLHDADKMLKCLELKVKQERDEVVETADRAFDELGASLLLRKNKLLAELVKSINNYSASVAKVKEVIEERKKCLMDAVRIAREFKITPSIRTYFDLPQVIYTLKLPVEAELSQVKSLSEKLFPRFFLNTDENTSLFQNVGKIEWETVHEGNGRHSHILDDEEEIPDVIIEEIFEDDVEGMTELVFVSHVVNPCHFYVRRYSQKKEARVLEKKLENFCCSKSSHLLSSDFLELGARTFIKSKETEMWCRGTITELIPLKSENKRKPYGPLRYRVCDIALLEVFLTDLGSTVVLICSGYVPAERPEAAALETVETDDLCLFLRKPDRHIEAELAAVPPLAVQCSLKDIVPKNASEGWGEEVKIKFLGMVKNKVVSMTIFREEDGVLIVDLRKPPFNKISDNMPVSLKDALVFLDLAKFKSQLPGQLENNTILQYSPPKIPQEREEVSVVVCHINSPSDFYLQLSDSLYSPALSKRIQNVYKHEYGENLEIICPVEGQACVAKQEDGNWYRARIIGLPSNHEVMVKYVDFGSVAHITLKDIRRIKKEFLSSPEKAIRCGLACIEPYKGANEWDREATKRFEEMTEYKHMQCLVDEILDNNILSVELFDSSALHGRYFSINCQLVEENLASFTPGCTARATVRPNEIWDGPPEIRETSEGLSLTDMKSVDEGDFRSLSKKELQVRISHVVSPSKIFIQWLSSEHTLKSLQKEMATTYRESQPQSVKWECNMHCAVYVHDLKQWQRGQISRIVSKTRAEVILYDSGVEKTVDISCLRRLEENMKIIGTLAIECSLADISPTGGSTRWTATVCEYLSSYLTGAQVKIIIQRSDETYALPVDMLYKDETGKLVDISEHLVQKGLALRRRRTNKADVACSVSKKHFKVHVEQEDAQLDGRNSEAACARNSTAPEESIIVSESEQKSCKRYQSVLYSGRADVYKSPTIPEEKVFQAVVSCIGYDGTIYVIPKSFGKVTLRKICLCL